MLFGRKFTLQTDHKPLLAVFGGKKGIPVYTANRLQRWALTLMLYDFDIQFIPTASFGHADLLSRLMSSQRKPEEEYVIAAIQMESDVKAIFDDSVSTLPVTAQMIVNETTRDPVLQEVIHFIKQGWPQSAQELQDPAVRQFYARRNSLQVVRDCIMFGDRIIVPECFRKRVIRQLHRGHPGMERMKSLARSFVYWPNIDDDVEAFVRQCNSCAEAAKSPRKVNLESWPIPTKPWERIHIDYAGPIDGYYYLVIVDAFSKWPEIFRTRSTTTTATLEILQETFARYGNPRTIVSDNGTQFVSANFKRFCEENGITHLTTAPYHPQSNGQAERFVDTLKRGLKKLTEGGNTSTFHHLQTFLSVYRSTPSKSTPDGKTPAHLFLGRPMNTTLDLLKLFEPSPTLVNEKQNAQFNKRHGTIDRVFNDGDLVYAKVHRRNSAEWIPGEIVERRGKVNFNVLLNNGRLIHSHVNQLQHRHQSPDDSGSNSVLTRQLPVGILLDEFRIRPMVPEVPEIEQPVVEPHAVVPVPPIPEPEPVAIVPEPDEVPFEPAEDIQEEDLPSCPEPNVEHSVRNRRLPAWLAPYDLF